MNREFGAKAGIVFSLCCVAPVLLFLSGCSNTTNQIDYGDPDFKRGWFAGWDDCDVYSEGFFDAYYDYNYENGYRNPDVEVEPKPGDTYYLYDTGYNDGWGGAKNLTLRLKALATVKGMEESGWNEGWDICEIYASGYYTARFDVLDGYAFSAEVSRDPEVGDEYFVYDTGYNKGWIRGMQDLGQGVGFNGQIQTNTTGTPTTQTPTNTGTSGSSGTGTPGNTCSRSICHRDTFSLKQLDPNDAEKIYNKIYEYSMRNNAPSDAEFDYPEPDRQLMWPPSVNVTQGKSGR